MDCLDVFDLLPEEIIKLLVSQLSIKDKINCRSMNKLFYNNISFVEMIIWLFDKKINVQNKIYMYEDDNKYAICNFNNCGNYIPCRHELKYCINNNCCENLNRQIQGPLRRKKVVGSIYFYYPNYLPPTSYDIENSGELYDGIMFNNVNFEIYDQNTMNRIYACQEGPIIKRHIPYCMECMERYVNFGNRNDSQNVPYGGPDGLLINY